MSASEIPLEDMLAFEEEMWADGVPHDFFRRLRNECPVHFTKEMREFPEEPGFWSIVKADDMRTVSRDWETFSSEIGGIIAATNGMPLELMQSMFIAMDPPKHDRLKALFQRGFTPKRIAMHEDDIRAIVRDELDKLDGHDTCDVVHDIAQPVVARVICSFMGIADEDVLMWSDLINKILAAGDPDINPDGLETIATRDMPLVFEKAHALVAARRENPTDDLTSVLVHAEIDGDKLEEHEIVMGFFLLMAAGNDSTKSTFASAVLALLQNPDQKQKMLENMNLVPSTVEESLRMFPAFAHFRRTATKDTVINGQEIKKGDKVVMWYVAAGRDEDEFQNPDQFDVERNPTHQSFGAGGRHFCLGAALARLELKILLEETFARYPQMELDGKETWVVSGFVNQLKTLPVKLGPRAS
jgi:cholest-4-en-3-one 26-monooxygenase